MTRPLKITKDVHFRSMKRGRKVIQEGVEADRPTLGRKRSACDVNSATFAAGCV